MKPHIFLIVFILLECRGHEGGLSGEYPERGSLGSVIRVESVDGIFPTRYAEDVIRMPVMPSWMQNVKIKFIGTGFWSGMRFTLQQANETQCSDMYNLNRNHSWVPNNINYSTVAWNSCPLGGCPLYAEYNTTSVTFYVNDTTPTVTTSLSHSISESLTDTNSLTPPDTPTMTIPGPDSWFVPPDYYPFDFRGPRKPLRTFDVNADGTVATFSIPVDPYFSILLDEFIFCLESPTLHSDAYISPNRTSATLTVTETINPPIVDFTIDSRVKLQLYRVDDISGTPGSQFLVNGSTYVYNKPPYFIDFGDSGNEYLVEGVIQTGLLDAAFSEDITCGNLSSPYGWGEWVGSPVDSPMNITQVDERISQSHYLLQLSQPETLRMSKNKTLYLCARAQLDFPYFFPLWTVATDSIVSFRSRFEISGARHLGEHLNSSYATFETLFSDSSNFIYINHDEDTEPSMMSHFNTIRVIKGHVYSIQLEGYGLRDYMDVSINDGTCNTSESSHIETMGVEMHPLLLSDNTTMGYFPFITARPTTSYKDKKLCVSLSGPRVPREHTYYSGIRVTSYSIKGINTLPVLSDVLNPSTSLYSVDLDFGVSGIQWLHSNNLESHVRIKFEGGDGVGAFTGDEWSGKQCTHDESGYHQPSYVVPNDNGVYWSSQQPTSNSSYIVLKYNQTSLWRTHAFVCVSSYPWSHSVYEALPFRINFTTSLSNASYQEQQLESPGRIYAYVGYSFAVMFNGKGIWPHFRFALTFDFTIPCVADLTAHVSDSSPAYLSNVNDEHTYAEFILPYNWVSSPSQSQYSRICMSQQVTNGTDFSFNTLYSLTVMKLLTINRVTHLDVTYGTNNQVYNLAYTNGEVDNDLAFLSDCGDATRSCGAGSVTADYCSSTDAVALTAIAGCPRDRLGPGGQNFRRNIASRVQKPGKIIFMYDCQSMQYAPLLKICLSPVSGGTFVDTGLTIAFRIDVTSVEVDTQILTTFGNIKYLYGTQPIIKLKGVGLYPWMRIAMMPNCTTIPYFEYISDQNSSEIRATRPWSFVTNSDSVARTELQFFPSLDVTTFPMWRWKLCMSEYAEGSEYSNDFSIQTMYSFTVVQLKTVNHSRHLTIAYGDRMLITAQGFHLEEGMQVKLQTDCTSTAPATDFCQGQFGSIRASGCRAISDTICFPISNDGLSVQGIWFFLMQTMSGQHKDGLKICVSVWPRTNQQFYDTGIIVDFRIIVDTIKPPGRAPVSYYETVLVYKGYREFHNELWPIDDARYDRAIQLFLRGKGFRDTFRIKLQSDCGSLNSTTGGSAVVLHPEPDILDPASCGKGDTSSFIYLQTEHVSTGTPGKLEFCLSQLARGSLFEARSYIYFGVVELHTISSSGSVYAPLAYGKVGDLTFYGTSLMPYMTWKFDITASFTPGEYCEGAGDSFTAPQSFQFTGGEPRCAPPSSIRGLPPFDIECLPYSGRHDLKFEGGEAGLVFLNHSLTYRQVENIPICLSLWGEPPYFKTGLTVTTHVLVSSVESYGRHHIRGRAAFEDLYAYMRYPEHVITLHGYGFFDHHRVILMSGPCGEYDSTVASYKQLGPFQVYPIESIENQTTLSTHQHSSGSDRTAALVYMNLRSNLTALSLCYSVFSEGDSLNKNNFSLSTGVRFTTVDMFVNKFIGRRRDESDPITISYGSIALLLLGGTNLLQRDASWNQFLFSLTDDCDKNITLGTSTPTALTYTSVRDPTTQKMIMNYPTISFPASVTRQLSHQKLCFSPYQFPYHKFLDTGYEVHLECLDPAYPCSPGSITICDANATEFHQLALGCTCSFEHRTNHSCILSSQLSCNESSTCSSHGLCNPSFSTCDCDNGWYGASCEWCNIYIKDVRYTDSLKHIIVTFEQEYSSPLLTVASHATNWSCDTIIPYEYRKLLGDPTCYWESPTVLHIFIGFGADTEQGVIVLQASGISSLCLRSGDISTPKIIPLTREPQLPNPVILIPDEIGPCDGITLDASLSWGPGGEKNHQWRVENSSDATPFPNEFDYFIRNASESEAAIPTTIVPADVIPIGEYIVTLTIYLRVSKQQVSASRTFIKRAPLTLSSPAPLVILIPQYSPITVFDVENVIAIGPIEVSSFSLTNAAASCLGRIYNTPKNKKYKITWSVRWFALRGDTYVTDGSSWKEMSDGVWRSVPVAEQKQDKPTLYWPIKMQTSSGVFDSFAVNRQVEINVDVEMHDADRPDITSPIAVGSGGVKLQRRGTFFSMLKGGNRTISTNFTLELEVRLDTKPLSALSNNFRTIWWCNDTTTGLVEVPCPEPLLAVPVVTRYGLEQTTGLSRTKFILGPPTTIAIPPGTYLFTALLWLPHLDLTTVASAEITVEPVSVLGETLDAGIVPLNTSLNYQLFSHSTPIYLTSVLDNQQPPTVALYRYHWSVLNSDKTVVLSSGIDTSAETFSLPPKTLKAGGTYQVRVLIREIDSMTGLLRRQANPLFTFQTMSPPHGGRLRVEFMADGLSMLIAEGWVTEQHRYPLRYKFSHELFCESATGSGCKCCEEGSKVVGISGGCIDICSSCSCSLLSDYSYRSYLIVTAPRTFTPREVKYSVTITDNLGVEYAAYTVGSTMVEAGGVGAPATPTPPDIEPWMSDVDTAGLDQLQAAVSRQDVNHFLLGFAQMTTNMQFSVSKFFVREECQTITLPETSTESLSETYTDSETSNVTGVPFNVSMTLPTTPAPSKLVTRTEIPINNTITPVRAPTVICKTIFPDEEEAKTNLLPFFPKSKPLSFQVSVMLSSCQKMLTTLASSTEKGRLLELVISATKQPAFVNRESIDIVLQLAEDILRKSTYLNSVHNAFYDQLAAILSHTLMASASTLPDYADLTPEGLSMVSEEERNAIRAKKRTQAGRVQTLLQEITLAIKDELNIAFGQEWQFSGGGITRKCKSLNSQQMLSGVAQPNSTLGGVVLSIEIVSNVEPARQLGTDNLIDSCITTYPTMVHDYSIGISNLTGDGLVSYEMRDVNGTEIDLYDSFVLFQLPMDPLLYSRIASKKPHHEPACYWFDPQPNCNHSTALTCETTCCADSTSPWRLQTCQECCFWHPTLQKCFPGSKSGLGEFRSDFCTVSEFNSSRMICNCTHLTDFIQGHVPLLYDNSQPILPYEVPVRIVEDLPDIPFADPPNLLALPQVLILPIIYVWICLISLYRERKFRIDHLEKQFGDKVQAPWNVSLKVLDKQYARHKNERDETYYVRMMNLSRDKSSMGYSETLDHLLTVIKTYHTYANIYYLSISDNRTIVQKITALFCGISSSWAMCARLWVNTQPPEQTAGRFMTVCFGCAALIGPISFIFNYIFSKTPRTSRPSCGDHVRRQTAEGKNKLRLGHERIFSQLPNENPEFYDVLEEVETLGIESAFSKPKEEERSKNVDAVSRWKRLKIVSGAVAAARDASEKPAIASCLKERSKSWGESLLTTDIAAEKARATEVDLVISSMGPWKTTVSNARDFLLSEKSDLQAIDRLITGSHHVDNSDTDSDTEAASRKVSASADIASLSTTQEESPSKKKKKIVRIEEEEPHILDRTDEVGILKRRKFIHEKAAYEVKCGRFIAAIHMFYTAEFQIQIQRSKESDIGYQMLLLRAKRQVAMLACQCFDFDERVFQVALAFEERKSSKWYHGISTVRDSSNLLEAASLFLSFLSQYPTLVRTDMTGSIDDVKAWVHYYYTRSHRDEDSDISHFDAIWDHAVSDNETAAHSQQRLDGLQQIDLAAVLQSNLGYQPDQKFSKVEAVAELVRSSYVRAEYIVNNLRKDEHFGNLLATGEPGEFTLDGVLPLDVENFAQDTRTTDLCNAKFWIKYFAFNTKGVPIETFDSIYSKQLALLQKNGTRNDVEGKIVHIPTKVKEVRDRELTTDDISLSIEDEECEEDEEDEEIEEQPSEEQNSENRSNDVPRPATAEEQMEDEFKVHLDEVYEKFRSRFMGKAEEPVQQEPVPKDDSANRLEGNRIKFGRVERTTFYVCTKPTGFRSLGSENQLGNGTIDDPFCTVDYAVKYLKTQGFPATTLCLLGGIYPPLYLKGLRNCDITRASEKVRIKGSFGWKPVIVLDSCRDVRVFGLEISHGSIGVDATTSTNAFIYENVISNVIEGVTNPTFGDLGLDDSAQIDLNYCNFIYPRFIKQPLHWPYNYNYLNYFFCILTAALSMSYWIQYSLGMDNMRLGMFYASCYVCVFFDFAIIQPFYCYWNTQRERMCSVDAWNFRMETGSRPGYPIDDEIGEDDDEL